MCPQKKPQPGAGSSIGLRVRNHHECRNVRAGHDDRVASIIADAASLGEHFEQSNGVIRLVDHRVRDCANDGDGPAAMLFHHDAHFRMTDQSVGLQHVRDHLLRLHLRQAGNVQSRGQQRNADRARLADAHFACEFGHIKHGYAQKIAISDGVFMGSRLRSDFRAT